MRLPLALFLTATALCAPAVAQDSGQFPPAPPAGFSMSTGAIETTARGTLAPEAVTLSTSGSALISAGIDAGGGAARFAIDRAHIDAFLKSVQIFTPSGAPVELRLAGPSRAENLFKGLPFSGSDLGSTESLLQALRGRPVELSQSGTALRGQVLGMGSALCAEDTVLPAALILLESGVVRQVCLDPDLTVRPLDPQDVANLARAAALLPDAVADDMISMEIEGGPDDAEEIGLTFLQNMTPWRTAWRAEVSGDDVTLTGWAIVENTTDMQWRDVTLTLATGAVQTLSPQLYDPRGRMQVAEIRPEAGGIGFRELSSVARMTADSVQVSAPAPVMEQSDSFSRYTLPEPVSLAPGEMVMVPFLTETLPNARELRYSGGSGAEHPELVLRIENPLPLRLPEGVLTLYEDRRRHAGDAWVPEIAAQAEEVIRFAEDTSVTVSQERDTQTNIRTARLVDGVLQTRESIRQTTTYRIEGASDGARTTWVEHPRNDRMDVITPDGEEALRFTRWQIEVPEGQIVSFPVAEERIEAQSFGIMEMSDDQLRFWSTEAPTGEVRDTFTQIINAREEIAGTERQLDITDRRIADLNRSLDHTLSIIDTIGTASEDRLRRVEQAEQELEALNAERRVLRQILTESEDRLREIIKGEL